MRMLDHGKSAEASEAQWHLPLRKKIVERAAEPRNALRELELKPGSLLFKAIQNGPCGGHCQRVSDECPGEKRNAGFGEGFVAILPHPAVESIHVLSFASQYAK